MAVHEDAATIDQAELCEEFRRRRLLELLRAQAVQEGFSDSPLEGVQYLYASRHYPRAPVVYKPSVVIIAQGRKRGYLGDRVYTIDAHNYLVLSVPLPFECETEASAATPLLGISVQVDPPLLAELLLGMGAAQIPAQPVRRGMYSTPLNSQLTDAVIRLLECLESSMESRILGPQIVREIIYRVLCGEQSGALREAAAQQSHACRISRVLHRIHNNYSEQLDVTALADEASMSLSTFHRSFKAVTSASPLQYLKTVRLHKARMLMIMDGISASGASLKVGYESPSQFSREFKRFFGISPSAEATRVTGRRPVTSRDVQMKDNKEE